LGKRIKKVSKKIETGTVVHVVPEKGYAFVRRDQGGMDFFFHFSQWYEEDTIPVIGARVQFELGNKDEKRPRPNAVHVSLIRPATATVLGVLSGETADPKVGA
jgi:cold shock CspA family protein